MSNVVPISGDEERLEAASRWVVRLDERLSAEDQVALERWLGEDPGNAVELVEVARAWDKLDCLSRLADVFPIEAPAVRSNAANRSVAWLAAAACALLLVGAAWLLAPRWYPGDPARESRVAQGDANFDTAIGEHRSVTLADGTAVTLNTNTRIEIAYSGSARLLELVRGEIHVEVVPDAARPFGVVAGDRVVEAVGTAFTVELTAGHELDLVVTEGTVKVGARPPRTGSGEKPAAADPGARPAVQPRMVSAGQELIVRASEEVIVPVSTEDMEVRLAWRDGRLIFRDEPLAQAIAEIERYTTVDFVFLDESLRHQSISGRYKTGDIESLLLALRANFGIGYEYDGDNRILLRSL